MPDVTYTVRKLNKMQGGNTFKYGVFDSRNTYVEGFVTRGCAEMACEEYSALASKAAQYAQNAKNGIREG